MVYNFLTPKGIGLYSVGITDEIDEAFLAAISGDVGMTNGQQRLGYDYFKAPDFQALDSMLETVSTGICERPTPSMYFLYIRIFIFPFRGSLVCDCKIWFTQVKEEYHFWRRLLKIKIISLVELQDCDLIDLCIVIDSSGSIRDRNPPDGSYDNWQLILQYASEVLYI